MSPPDKYKKRRLPELAGACGFLLPPERAGQSLQEKSTGFCIFLVCGGLPWYDTGNNCDKGESLCAEF